MAIPFLTNTSFSAAVTVASTLTVGGDVTISKATPKLTFNNLAGGGLDPSLTASGSDFTIATSSITPLTIALDTGNATFAGDVIIDDGVGRITLASVSGENRIQSTTTGFGAYEKLAFTADDYEFKLGNATFAGDVDVNGTQITVGTNSSIFAENNLRFKSTGAAFIDHNTVGQSIKFRVSSSSSLDVTPLEITASYVSFANVPIVGTMAAGNNTTRAASTAFVTTAVASAGSGTFLPLIGGTMTGNTVNTPGTEVRFGNSNELGIFHSSGVSNIRVNSGYLAIRADDMRFMNQDTTEKMRITSAGNVGIGITTPGTLNGASYGTTKLHVDGGTDRGQVIIEGDAFAGIVMSDNGATANQKVFATSVDNAKYTIKPLNDNGTSTAGGVAITVLHGGNVGIGDGDPNMKLKVKSSGADDGIALIQSSSTAKIAQIIQTGSGDGALLVTNGSGAQTILIRGTGNSYLNAGNLGIGTTLPEAKLDIHKSEAYGTFGPGRDGHLNLTNTNTNTEAGWMSVSGYMNNGGANTYYQMGGIGGGKASASGNGKYGGYMSLWTTSEGNNGEANSGMYERMRITADGDVGIGTTGPEGKLNIESGAESSIPALGANTTFIKISNTGGAYGTMIGQLGTGNGYIQSQRFDGTATAYNLLLQPNAGNVGIGTPSPIGKLTVQGDDADIFLRSNDYTIARIINRGSTGANLDTGLFSLFAPVNTENVRIDAGGNSWLNGGNVGIGTTQPDAKLSVTSTTLNSEDILYLKSGADNVNDYLGIAWELGVGGDGPHSAIRSFAGPSGSDARLGFLTTSNGGTNLTEGLSIAHDGNVGIGITDPRVKLQVNGTNASVGTIGTPKNDWYTTAFNGIQIGDGTTLWGRAGDTHLSGNYYVKSNSGVAQDTYINTLPANDFWLDNSSGSLIYRNAVSGTAGSAISFSTRFTVLNNGNFGIGTTSPDFKLDVDGTLGVYDLPGNATSTSALVRNETIGPELLSNGDFTGNPDLWGGDESITNGQLTKTGGGLAYQSISLTGGSTYFITVDVASISGTPLIYAAGLQSGGLSAGLNELYLIAGSSNTLFGFNNGSGSVFNSVSLKLVTSASDQIQTRQLGASAFSDTEYWKANGNNIFNTNSSNVGIGTNSPQNTLHLGDNTNSSAGTLRIDSFVANQFWKFEPGTNTLSIKDYDGTSLASFDGANNYVLFNGGNVGIGLTNPDQKLVVNGSIKSLGGGSFAAGVVFASNISLAANITILNKAQTTYIPFATRDISGSEVVMDLTNVSINGGAVGPYLPLAGGTMVGNTLHGDNIKSIYGTGNDLQIFHNGSNYISSIIKDTYYTGTADVGTSAFSQIFKQTNFNGGDEEYLRISGPTRQVLFSRDAKFFDNIKCTFGTSATNSLGDLRIYHDATDSKIENLTGDLYIINESLDKDVIIQSDNGTTGEVTDYFRADGSTGNSILYGDYGTKRLETTSTGVTITGSGNYNTLKITNSVTANANKQTGICSLNYIGNSTSIMQYATNASANVVYYGSADGGFRGITQHSFYVSSGPDTVSHSLGMQIKSGTVVVPGKMTIGSTTLPAVPLDVFGGAGGASVRVRGNMDAGAYYYGYMFDGGNVQGTTQSNVFYAEGAVAANTTITDWASFRCLSPSTAATGAVITNNYGIYQQSNAQKNFFAGSVGIGTITPDYKLEVEGTISSCDSALQKATFANVGADLVLTANADATNVTANILFKSSGAGGASVSEKMRIDSTGNVGIGIIPGDGFGLARLSLGTGAVANEIISFASASGGNAELRNTSSTGTFTFTNSDGSSEKMRIAAGGNVGIGTTNPNSKLTVSGPATPAFDNGENSIRIENHSSANASPGEIGNGINFAQKWWSGSAALQVTGGIYGIKNAANGTFGGGLAFYTQPSSGADMAQRMVIDTLGNVGIGTTTPSRGNLVVKGDFQTTASGDGQLAIISGVSGSNPATKDIGGQMVFGGPISASDSNRTFGLVGGYKENNTSGDRAGYLTFGTRQNAGSRDIFERMRIDSIGNVGIGTTVPGAKLDVEDGHIRNTNNSSADFLDIFCDGEGTGSSIISSSSNDIVIRSANGELGIKANAFGNTGNHGVLKVYDGSTALGVVKITLNSNGNSTFTSTITASNFILSSDKRLKENIKTLEPKVISAEWRSFNAKDDDSYRTGVIAQELEVKHPEFVETNEEGFKSVKYIDLLISKIAELEHRIKQLEK